MTEATRSWRTSARSAAEQPPARMTYSAIIAGHRDLPGAAVRTAGGGCTWPELLGRTTSAVRWLEEIGADPGEPVAALVTTGLDVIALTLAAAAAGKPLAPLGPRLTERELVPCVRGIDAKVLAAEPEFAALGERVAAASGARLVVLPGFPVAAAIELPEPRMEDIAVILHTSGTTGLPRPVPMSQRMLAQRALVNSVLLRLDSSGFYATASPFHHIAGWGTWRWRSARARRSCPRRASASRSGSGPDRLASPTRCSCPRWSTCCWSGTRSAWTRCGCCSTARRRCPRTPCGARWPRWPASPSPASTGRRKAARSAA